MTECRNCQAWLPIQAKDAERGRCHRRAPQVIFSPETADFEAMVDTVWPETARDEGCFDALPKPDAAP